MLPASLHSGFLRCTEPNRMFLPTMDLADEHQPSSMDLFTSVFDGSRLVIPCPGTGPLRRRSSSPPLHTAVKSTSFSHRKKRRHGASAYVSASEEESPMAAAAMPGAVTPLLA
ncbi:hypothetical protein AMECASPLE_027203 [Ameca splendens]|uniref:Uncharacterized protein n=1 Tax=Ameca splendens TaxID=208324 RepID=A0ABV0YSD6_9TELE